MLAMLPYLDFLAIGAGKIRPKVRITIFWNSRSAISFLILFSPCTLPHIATTAEDIHSKSRRLVLRNEQSSLPRREVEGSPGCLIDSKLNGQLVG